MRQGKTSDAGWFDRTKDFIRYQIAKPMARRHMRRGRLNTRLMRHAVRINNPRGETR